MAGRPRCAQCRKAFTPNYRNRTKVENRQRVCAACGPVVGHRLADRRYRANNAPPRREPVRAAAAAPAGAVAPASGQVGSRKDPSGSAAARPEAVSELAAQVDAHLAAIAGLGGGAVGPDGCGASRPLPIGIFEKSRPAGDLMAAKPRSGS